MAIGDINVNKIEMTIDFEIMLLQIANDMVEELKRNSPKDTGAYASNWASKKIGDEVVVYNKKYGNRVHLLENGHIIRKKRGVRRIAPQSHVYPAFQKTLKNYKKYKPKINY